MISKAQQEKLDRLKANKDPAAAELFQSIKEMASKVKAEKGDKGESGYTPVKGVDYYTSQEIAAIIRHIQTQVKDGEPGQNGKDGKDGIDGINGRTPVYGRDYFTDKEQEKLLKTLLGKIKIPKPQDPIDIEDVVSQVTTRVGKQKVSLNDITDIDNLVNFLKLGGFRGGGLSNITGLIQAGTNITLTGQGTSTSPYVINSSGGGASPAGAIKSMQYNLDGTHFGGGTAPSGNANPADYQMNLGYDQTNPLTTDGNYFAPLLIAPTITQNANNSGYIFGEDIDFTLNGSGTIGGGQGNFVSITYSGSGTVTDSIDGIQGQPIVLSGTFTNSGIGIGGLIGNVLMTGGTANGVVAGYFPTNSITGTASVLNNYGVKIDNQSGATNNWNLWSGDVSADLLGAGSFSKNVFVTLNNGDASNYRQTFGSFNYQNSGTVEAIGGVLGISFVDGTANVDVAVGLEGDVIINTPGHTTNNAWGFVGFVEVDGGAVGSAYSVYSQGVSVATGATLTEGVGVQIDPANTIVSGGTISNLYGLRIGDQVAGGTNYSIYTGLGNIRLGSLAGTGTQMVTADINGILSKQVIPTGTVTSVASADGSINVTNPTTNVDLAIVKSPKLTTGRTIAITGDLAYTSPSFDGSGNVTAAGTLATVNSNVGSFTNASITVNGKGLITAASSGTAPVTAVSIATANGFSGSSSGGGTPALTIVAGAITPTSVNGLTLHADPDGWDITGGTTPRKLTVTGADQTLTGSGSVVTTFPNEASTIAGIVGTARAVGQTTAVNLATYTVGGSDASYYVSANVLVTVSTLHNFTITCTYTDEGNTSRTLTLPFQLLAGTSVTSITNAQGAVPYEGTPLHIRAKAGTTIIIASAAGGTYTTVTYNLEERIVKL